MRTSEDSLIGSHRGIIFSYDTTSDSDFFFQLHSWDKEVFIGGPEVGIDMVHNRNEVWIFESSIAEKLASMHPVFLLYVSVIVLAVWS
jgi:hypothetical protein